MDQLHNPQVPGVGGGLYLLHCLTRTVSGSSCYIQVQQRVYLQPAADDIQELLVPRLLRRKGLKEQMLCREQYSKTQRGIVLYA
jgi:hypothetical protein